VAINPETPLDLLRDKIFDLDFVCVMGVTPGQSGQKFDESAIQKVADLRAAYPDLRIEVDGGVNQETIAPLVRAGATALVVSSALFKSPNFGAAYRSLQAAANI
jgi:ribulose-phosphate 3-epimerase